MISEAFGSITADLDGDILQLPRYGLDVPRGRSQACTPEDHMTIDCGFPAGGVATHISFTPPCRHLHNFCVSQRARRSIKIQSSSLLFATKIQSRHSALGTTTLARQSKSMTTRLCSIRSSSRHRRSLPSPSQPQDCLRPLREQQLARTLELKEKGDDLDCVGAFYLRLAWYWVFRLNRCDTAVRIRAGALHKARRTFTLFTEHGGGAASLCSVWTATR